MKTFRVAFCMVAFVSFHEDIAGVFESMKKTGNIEIEDWRKRKRTGRGR